ncbi:tRNA (5-methylaminomethyl-2-thiouridine)(34)-methyltransferase MnmD [Thioalkalivibrio sp. ALJ16]|uniref:tRNA (5-methylaminomethyl-2-thiouridine)(34)-methyltransferase MnmD n=1 Tax=Thioalkalivibrio sp. ALJ16 TaxID=1158762 RepID=UPI000371C82E|nr:tRNA (5-methylaminomethyl-2-thiouridine)(34)-methyltransferase MnmD [Thioalkalivibrio sp. ALJ16]
MLDWARLEWRNGQPFAVDYGDGYFGSSDPRAEVREVFIEANALAARFRQCRRFVLAETGFGSGLNLLLALETWRREAPPGAFLSMLSLEAHPLSPEDLAAIHARLGLDGVDAQRLRSQYPPPVAGLHRIEFPEARAALTLALGDAAPLLSGIQGQVDAWFLDGFAPRNNPALWNTGVFRQVARLSAPGATFGTYTAAGQVRRDLEGVGFEVQRVPGHGRKRERLQGVLHTRPQDAPPAPAIPERVAVVGAGLAGLAAAHALRARGVAVDVFDPAGIAGGASGNPAAVLLPNLHPQDPELNQLALAGMRRTASLVGQLEAATGQAIRLAAGVAFHGISAHGRKRVQRLQKAGPARAGLLFDPAGPGCASAPHLFYPDALALDMRALCEALAAELAPVQREAVQGIQAVPDGPLRLEGVSGGAEYDAVVLAMAAGGDRPLCPEETAIATVDGQMTRVQAPLPDWGGFVATGQGYCIPKADGRAWIGATYRHTDARAAATTAETIAEDDRANLRHLAWVPGLEDASAVTILESWAGTRAVVRDRLPLVGASRMDPDARVLLSLAHGSRGLLYAPLAGEWLADHLLGLIEPLDVHSRARLDPMRAAVQPAGSSAEA